MSTKSRLIQVISGLTLSALLWAGFRVYDTNKIISILLVVVGLGIVLMMHKTFLQLSWTKQVGVVSFCTVAAFLIYPIISGSVIATIVMVVILATLTIIPFGERALYASPKELTEEVTVQLKESFEKEGEFTAELEVDTVSTIHTESVPTQVIEAQNLEREEIGEEPRHLPDKQNLEYKAEIGILYDATYAWMINSDNKETLAGKALSIEVPAFLKRNQEELAQLLEDKLADPDCVPYLDSWEQLKVRLGDARSDSRNEGYIKP